MSWYYWSPRPVYSDGDSADISETESIPSPRFHSGLHCDVFDDYDSWRKKSAQDEDTNSMVPVFGSAKSRSYSRVQRIHKRALKDELQKQGQRRRRAGSDVHSTRSAGAPTVASHSDREGSARGRRVRRSRSLGRDDLSEVGRNDSSPETSSHRRRSRSQDRGGPWTGGYWTYVPPPPPVWGSVPAGRAYTRIHATDTAPSPTAVYTVPPVVHTAPIIGPPSNLIYVDPQQTASQSRVYIPSVSRSARIYTTPSKPQASIYIAPKSSPSSRRSVRKANIYIVESDDEQPLRRSHLSTLKRSSSLSRLNRDATLVALPDSRLNDSIERAERSAENLRSRSRSMYRSVRDNVYQAQLLADTM